jgi:hypothetical protein
VPQGLSLLLGGAFAAAGVPVHYSADADNDDTLAACAHARGAAVLSGDKDFFRYTVPASGTHAHEPARYQVFSGWHEHRASAAHGRAPGLTLLRHEGPKPGQRRPSPRDLILPPPAVMTLADDPSFGRLPVTRHYLRGAPSPLVRALGPRYNEHLVARPLRTALYALKFGNLSPALVIREEFPVWDDRIGVDWDVTDVAVPSVPDPAWQALLLGPPLATVAALFPAEAADIAAGVLRPGTHKQFSGGGVATASDWKMHCFACKGVVFELCCAATRRDYLQTMMEG